MRTHEHDSQIPLRRIDFCLIARIEQMQRRMEGQGAAARDWSADPENVAWADQPFVGPMLEQNRAPELLRLADAAHQDRQRAALDQTIGAALGAVQSAPTSHRLALASVAQPAQTDPGPLFPDTERRPGAFGYGVRPGPAYFEALNHEQALNRGIEAAEQWKTNPNAARNDPLARYADPSMMAMLSDPAFQSSARRDAAFDKADALEFDNHHYREILAERAKRDVGANALMDERRGGPWGGKPFTESMRDNYSTLVAASSNPNQSGLVDSLRQSIRNEAKVESALPHWRPEFSNGGSVPVPSLAAPEFSGVFDRHDEAYYSGTLSRDEADRRLYQDMLAAIEEVKDPIRRQALREKAGIIYRGVWALGRFGQYKPR